MIKAVVFDIDGTLTTPSYGSGWLELTKSLGGDPDKHIELYNEVSAGRMLLDKAKQQLLSAWKSKGSVTKEKMREIFSLTLLREGAKETMQYLQSKGYAMALISGSPDIYAEVIAERLGIAEYFANNFKYNDEGDLIDFEYDVQQDEKKLRQLKEYLKKNSFSSNECAIVGDGWNDNLMFAYTGNGIALKSPADSYYWDSRLEAIAWRVIERLLELKGIL